MRLFTRALVALLVSGVVSALPASAGASEPACSEADAQLLFERAVQGFDLLAQGITDRPIVDLVQRCQYRVYQDGAEFTFSENDVFLGGVFYYYTMAELDALGWTRQQGIEDLKLIDTQVWLARKLPDGSTGPLVEQNLRQSAFKNYVHSQLGALVYTHVAFTSQLSPGDYLSIFHNTYPGEPDFDATVLLHIVPADA
jgi:hypothetical protein